LDPEIDYQMVNRVLTNGARFYVDHAHPEYSSPECTTAMDALVYDAAGEAILQRAMARAREMLPDDEAEIVVYKNNSDGKGNSYGCHENYLVSRDVPFSDLVHFMTTHFVTRQTFTGSGKIGCENGRSGDAGLYQLSQRADFFEEEVGLETTLRRPIINTRDEPHADSLKYRRFHVIVGDANMSQTATLLKVGTTQILLGMIEDDAFPRHLVLADPLRAMREVSRDTRLECTVELVDGKRMSALDIQFQLLEAALRWASQADGIDKVIADRSLVIREWGNVLRDLSSDVNLARDRVDWVAKLALIDGYRDRHGLHSGDARLKVIDLQYHDLREDRCLARRSSLAWIIDEATIERAVHTPPTDTRAYLRGEVLRKWPEGVVTANWDSLLLDVGNGALARVPMDEPLAATKDDVGVLIDTSANLGTLVERLLAADR
jgi:proteasome accessory factor PafA2